MKRTVVCLLILALVLVWPVGAMAAGEETVTTTGGEETVAVKEIHTVEDLQAVANDPDGSYILMENLDLAGVEWKPLDFRGTFDDEIFARQDRLSLSQEPGGKRLLPDGMVLMELKTSGAIPLWMTKHLTQNRIFKTSFSKYGTAYQTQICDKGAYLHV